MKLQGKVVIITGATSGIGLAILKIFLSEGAKVAFCSRNINNVERVQQMLTPFKDSIIARALDVSDSSSVFNFINEVISKFGRVDTIINNAGILIRKSLIETEIDDFEQTLDINLKGPFLFCKMVLPFMEKGPIINISSTCAIWPLKNLSAYCASKAGLVALGKSLALELKGSSKVKVFTICPGPINTPLLAYNIGNAAAAKAMSPDKVGSLCLNLVVGKKSPPSGSTICIGKITVYQRVVGKIRRIFSFL